MAEQLLDRSQVRPALEQVGGEGVAQRVGRDAAGDSRVSHPELEPATQVGGVKPAAALGDEQGRFERSPSASAGRPRSR